MEDVRKQERKKGIFRKKGLPGRFIARKLYGWTDKRYDEEYWARLERNWRCQKRRPIRGQEMMEMIKKEEKKLVKKNLNLGSKMKRTMKWRIFVTPTMSCKNPWDKES